MAIDTHLQRMSVDEYLELERTSDIKHEFVHGEVFAFAGASERHVLIALRIASLLTMRAMGGNCRVFMSDMRLQVAPDVYYYPDIIVTCDETDDDPFIKRKPCLVIEVLSPNTTRIDRSEKLFAYQAVHSLRAYLIVDTGTRRVTRHWRDDADMWQQVEIIGEGDVPFPCPEITMSLADIYAGIN